MFQWLSGRNTLQDDSRITGAHPDPGDSAGFHRLVHGGMLSTSVAGDAGSLWTEPRWALLGSGR